MKINNCPKCGSEEPVMYARNENFFKIVCEHCGLEQFGWFSRKEFAVRAWNEGKNPSPFWEEKNEQ